MENHQQRLLKTLMNVLLVWESRNVFAPEYVKALRGALFAEQRKQLQQCIQEQQESSQPINEESLLEESYNVENSDNFNEGPQTPPQEVNVAIEDDSLTSAKEHNEAAKNSIKKARKRRREDRKSKKRKSRRRHEELGPRPEPKIDLQKLESDVLRLLENAASSDQKTREKLAQLPNEVQDASIMNELTDANTLELLYQLVSRATSMVSEFTTRVKEEQQFRQTLYKTMKIAKKEQANIFGYERKELTNNRRIIEVFSGILDNLEKEQLA